MPNRSNTPRQQFVLDAVHGDTNDCVIWPFTVNGAGYGTLRWKGTKVGAHRLALVLATGSPGHGLHAAHQPGVCTSKRCINPYHLRWATVSENVLDRAAEGVSCRADQSGQSKLTDAQVLDIYTSRDPGVNLAERYGVTPSMVTHIRKGRAWAWLTRHRITATGDSAPSKLT